jgi:hypothetical protein
MSSVDPFNAVGGFSVGIPPELVIDDTGNVVNNVNAPNSNVTANRVFANAYFYANGNPLSIGASGSNRAVQFNNNGLLGGSNAFIFNSTTNLLTVTNLAVSNNANLGNVATVKILGGINGYFLQTDGTGNLTWAPAGNASNGGNGSPAGANTQVQFNNEGNFGGDPGFTYNSATNLLSVDNITVDNILANYVVTNHDITANVVVANYLYGDGSNISNVVAVSAATANSVAGANVTGQVNFANIANNVAGSNVSGQVNFANTANNVAGSNVSGQVANALVAGTVYVNAQPNITSVGNLSSLTVVGNTTLGNQVTANFFIGNLFGLANLARNVTLGAQPNITSLGTLTSLTVSGNTTLGNSVTANFFIGNLQGVANSAVIANTANLAIVANTANFANTANLANNTLFSNTANIANTALNVNGANVTGQVANALVAGTVYTNAQPNITSLGQLTSLTVLGNTVSGNIYANAGTVRGNLLLGNIGTANQPGITNVGNLINLTVLGNTISGNVYSNTGTIGANLLTGTLTTNNQPNINYLGNIGWLNVNTSIPNSNGNITFNGSMNGTGVGSNITITGNLNAGNYVEANLLIGTLTTNLQPNITTIGNLTSLTVVGTTNLGNVGNVKILGGNANFVLSTDGTGNLNWVPQSTGGGNGTPGGSNTQIQYNQAGSFAGSGNFTYTDTTRVLYLNGNANITGTANILTQLNSNNLTVTNNANLAGNIVLSNTTLSSGKTLTVVGNINAQTSANVNLGNVSNIHILGGINGYALTTDGTGNLSWKNVGGGNGSNPGGSNTQIQFNDGGLFGGSPFLTFNKNTNNAQVAGNLIANALTLGSGVYQFSYSNVYFATTNSTAPEQVLISIEADQGVGGGNIAAIDYTIISTDNNVRNFVKISCVRIGSSLNYVEYSTLPINGYTGDFQVLYNAGNVIAPATIQLVMTPQNANLMTHKMGITAYYD